MSTHRKTRHAVEDALNGDIENIDSAVRRALYAISTEQDEHAEKMDEAHAEIMDEVKTMFARFEKTVNKLQAALSTIAVSMLVAVATYALQRVLG